MNPHTAPFAAGLNEAVHLQGGPSPRFNWPNQQWDNGEGFGSTVHSGTTYRADTGGYLGTDDGTTLQLPGDLHALLPSAPPNNSWELITSSPGNQCWRFVGALSPVPIVSGVVKSAAFEIFAPLSFNLDKPTVIVLSLYPTLSQVSRNIYSGLTQTTPLYGLRYDINGNVHRPAPNGARLMDFSGSNAAKKYNIVSAYIVPHIGTRSLIHTLQRNLQLERAVQYMLQTTSLNPPSLITGFDNDLAVLASGGSAGGLTSQLLATFYPNRIHGASSRSFSGSLRRTMGDQDGYTFAASLLGFGSPGQAYVQDDCLQWVSFLRQHANIGYYESSFVTLWNKRQIHRPIHFLFADEDNVTNGNEWASLFSGSYLNAGTKTNPDPASSHAPVFWSRLDKACHDSMSFVIPGSLHDSGSNTTEHDLTKSAVWMVPVAHNSFQTQSTVASVVFPAPSTDDPYDHALARRETSERLIQRGGFTPPTPLLAQVGGTWENNNRGCGTWLGHDNSLLIDGNAVYVGSADGVVSKLEVSAPGNPLTVVARTQSLGYRANAIAIDGNNLVVATYRRVYKFNKNSLSPTATPMGTHDLAWDQSRPGRMQIVDLYSNGIKYVMFRSYHGELVVLKLSDLSEHLSYGEPGIQDFEVGSTIRSGAPSGTSVPINLLSERGRVIQIEFTGTTPAVTGASVPFEGSPEDLAMFPSGTGSGLAALYRATGGGSDTIKLMQLKNSLSPDNLKLAGAFSDFTNLTRSKGGTETPFASFEFRSASGGLQDGFVVLYGGTLKYQSICGSCNRTLQIADDSTPASFYPTAFAFGELTSGGGDQIVISTESGQILYFPLADLAQQQLSTMLVSDWRVATWAMINGPNGKIQCLDQAARRWEVDPATGAAVLADTMLVPKTASSLQPMPKPFMDLAFVGYAPAILPPTGKGTVAVPVGTGNQELASWFTAPRSQDIGSALDPFLIPPSQVWTVPLPDKRWWTSYLQGRMYMSEYMPFSLGGESWRVGDSEYSYGWSGIGLPTCRNLVWGTAVPVSTSPVAITDSMVWGSAHNMHSIDNVTIGGYADHLRSVSGNVNHNLQSLRLGQWDGESKPKVVISTAGGSIMLLDPLTKPQSTGPSTILTELDHRSPGQHAGDHGTGGLALCVHDVRGDGNPTIFFGTIAADARSAGNDMVSSLMIYERTPAGLSLQQEIRFDGFSHPKLYGLCGIAIGNLDASYPDNKQIVLTTLSGDLLIYDLVSIQSVPPAPFTPVTLGSLRQWDIVDGSIGACNGILIDGASHKLYVAGSMGLRKWQ